MSTHKTKTVLAADIGGTKTNMALFAYHDHRLELQFKSQYSSQDFSDFSDIITRFLPQNSYDVDSACFGIAGPVIGGVCQTTNLPWTIETHTLQKQLGTLHVKLLNDLEATAYGMLYLDDSAFVSLNPNGIDQEGNRAVIAAGTGLGEALLYFDDDSYRPIGTEGGHSDFAPADEQQSALLAWLRRRYPEHVSIERILSGPGIFTLYEFLRNSGVAKEAEFMKTLKADVDKSAAVSRGALEMNDPLCHETLKLFARIYGAEAGNLALKSLSVGGVLIGGGIAPKILPYLQEHFMETFRAKGRFSPLLSSMPVHVSLEQETALLGAARFAKDYLLA